jgi:hypothetical protein
LGNAGVNIDGNLPLRFERNGWMPRFFPSEKAAA